MGKQTKIVIVVAMAIVVGVLIYMHVKDWHEKSIDEIIVREKVAYEKEAKKLEQQVVQLQKELSDAQGKSASQEKLTAAFGSQPAAQSDKSDPKAEDFTDIEYQLGTFFFYIDQKKYLETHKLKGRSYPLFQESVVTLSDNPPIITGETDNIFRVLKNLAHFYSALGKNRINFTRDVLSKEQDIIENAMRIFYLWFTMERKELKKFKDRPSDEMLYLYSGYFLQTIGGRSYLMRRDSKVRTLSYHYSVLLLDRANDAKLNSLGIDIRPHIEASLNNIQNQMGLAYRHIYMSELELLKDKYKI
jgi:hypothetical protein